jgi:hypothetical protein
MKNVFLGLALAASLILLAACSHPDQTSGPSADARAKFTQVRADAKTNTLQAISADHQSKVNAIVATFNAGSVSPRDAAKQIDAVLSPGETSAVLAQQQKMRDAMRAARPDGGNGSSGFSGRRRAWGRPGRAPAPGPLLAPTAWFARAAARLVARPGLAEFNRRLRFRPA